MVAGQTMTKANLFDEITMHLLEDEAPSAYFNWLSKEPQFMEYPLILLQKLKETEQSLKYHPEGSVWNHTMLVVDETAKIRNQSKDKKALMWAALLHDIGKPDTTRRRRDKITAYDHDAVGARLSYRFLLDFTKDVAFIRKVCALVRYHMHMLYIMKNLPYADRNGLFREVDIQEVAMLSKCDRMGRAGVDREKEEKEYQAYITKLLSAQIVLL
jgi:putative nucleotidyltransferase with HDIG domain